MFSLFRESKKIIKWIMKLLNEIVYNAHGHELKIHGYFQTMYGGFYVCAAHTHNYPFNLWGFRLPNLYYFLYTEDDLFDDLGDVELHKIANKPLPKAITKIPFGAKFPKFDCFTHELGKEYELGLIWISGEELYIRVKDISPYLCGMDLNLINLKGLSRDDFSKVHEINEVDNSLDLEIERLDKILKEQDKEIDKLNGL